MSFFEDEWTDDSLTPKELDKTPIKIKGTFSKLMFPKTGIMEDNEFAIIKAYVTEVIEGELHPLAKNKMGEISIKGKLPKLTYGEEMEYTLIIDEVHPTFGASYQVKFIREDYEFKNENDVKIFLSRILTETQLNNLYEIYDHPLDIIMNGNVDALIKVKGIGESTAEKIIMKYMSTQDYAQAYVELDEYNLTTNMILKLCGEYGSPNILINKIKENPYILTQIDGIGFKKADTIAMKSGMDAQDIRRVSSFIDYTLTEMGQQGMSWIDSGHLMFLIEESLGDEIENSIVYEAVLLLKKMNLIWNEEKGKIGSQKLYELELKIVKEIARLMCADIQEVDDKWEDRIKLAEKLQGWDYGEEQWSAISNLKNEKVSILLGLGGVGKTASALGIVKAIGLESFGLCCLAGKASARLQEATGYPASTVHRLLGFQNGEFTYNKDCKLPYDLIILDEYSLIGGELFYSLIQAIPDGCRFLMIGDMGQLASIGSLNIASDTIMSNLIPKNELLTIHRQAAKSAIITESYKVRHGIQLFENGWTGSDVRGELQDLELDIYSDKSITPKKVMEHFKKYQQIEKDIMEIQVISPMNLKGDSSVYALNKMIQNYYNPSSFDDNKPQLTLNLNKNQSYDFRVGDKVLNIKNNYKLKNVNDVQVDVFNGYTGIIKKIIGDMMHIYFPLADENYNVIVPASHWREKKAIALGYACSTHKFQGSGANCIIYCLDNSHHVMLCRQQLYTGLTRAKKHCTLVGQTQAVCRAIEIDLVSEKQTFMLDLLKEYIKGE